MIALRLRWAAALLCALLAAGCSTLPAPGADDAAADECARWFERLDAAVDAAGVRDAQDERVAGFAGLRIDRLGVALRERAAASDAAFTAWLAHAAALDASGRAVEIGNLPREAWPLAPDVPDIAAAQQRTSRCRDERVARWSRAAQSDRTRLLGAAQVPDRYALSLRTLGLYPLVRWPFFAGVNGWQDAHTRVMARWTNRPPAGLLRFVPPAGSSTAGSSTAGPASRTDALGVPRPTPEQAARWLAAHAPVFEIETTGAFDAFGSLQWGSSPTPRVHTASAVVYQRLAYAQVGETILPQLVYTLWFPERPREGAFDLLGGALDGVVVRLTLAPDGRVLLMDTIHACGCYHLFFPAAGVTLRPDPPRNIEWAFVPGPLPALRAGERLVVRIASRTHYVSGLARDDGSAGRTYELRPEDDLRRLPTSDGGTRSLYGPDGLVAGSERSERFLFWPMGIASAGAMRQWGHHATAFVGRRHFDDADLLDRRFEFALPD